MAAAEWEIISPQGEEEERAYFFSVDPGDYQDMSAAVAAAAEEGSMTDGGGNDYGSHGDEMWVDSPSVKRCVSGSSLVGMNEAGATTTTTNEYCCPGGSNDDPFLKRRRLAPLVGNSGDTTSSSGGSSSSSSSSSSSNSTADDSKTSEGQGSSPLRRIGSGILIASQGVRTGNGDVVIPAAPLISGPCMRIETSYNPANGEHKCLVFRSDRRAPLAKLIWTSENDMTAHVKSVFVHESVRGE